jgi:hypothetical protein
MSCDAAETEGGEIFGRNVRTLPPEKILLPPRFIRVWRSFIRGFLISASILDGLIFIAAAKR